MKLNLLKKKRTELGYDLSYVTSKTGISISSLSLYERGKVTPSADKLYKICAVLKLKMEDILGK